MATQEAIKRFTELRQALFVEREAVNDKLNAWLDTARNMDEFRSLINEWSIAHVNFRRYDLLLKRLTH
ncbi:hypothetical protein EVB99_004 [Rhizobium phage RHph_N3_19]|nr:hypothetical protein EVB99_004 [Rhizobium phage RHph_N3_19]